MRLSSDATPACGVLLPHVAYTCYNVYPVWFPRRLSDNTTTNNSGTGFGSILGARKKEQKRDTEEKSSKQNPVVLSALASSICEENNIHFD